MTVGLFCPTEYVHSELLILFYDDGVVCSVVRVLGRPQQGMISGVYSSAMIGSSRVESFTSVEAAHM